MRATTSAWDVRDSRTFANIRRLPSELGLEYLGEGLLSGLEYHAVHVRAIGYCRQSTDGVTHEVNGEPDKHVHSLVNCSHQRLVTLRMVSTKHLHAVYGVLRLREHGIIRSCSKECFRWVSREQRMMRAGH